MLAPVTKSYTENIAIQVSPRDSDKNTRMVVRTATIIRVQAVGNGTRIACVDGSSFDVRESYNEVVQAIWTL